MFIIITTATVCAFIKNMASRHIQRAQELSQDGFEGCADEHIKHAVELQQQFAYQSFGAALRFKYTDLEVFSIHQKNLQLKVSPQKLGIQRKKMLLLGGLKPQDEKVLH